MTKPSRDTMAKKEVFKINSITSFIHCAKCLEEIPDDTAPRDWAKLEVGWTVKGFQVWCKRHELNVIHVDFEGQKHPALVDEQKAFKGLFLVEKKH